MKTLLSLAAAAALTLLAGTAGAADYPAKTIRLIAPYPPGGQTDIVARLVADPLSAALGQPVVVENKPGGNGIIGHDYVAKAAPDGYTLLVGNSAMLSVMPNLTKTPFDPRKDFAPVVLAAGGPLVLEVNPALPVTNVQELIALAKAKPGQLNNGMGSLGTIHHLLTELIRTQAGVEWANVPYKGAGPMLVDLVSGQVDFAVDNTSSSAAFLKSGRLRPIAVSRRTDFLPGVPSLAEQGITGAEALAWHGILAPAGTPPEVVGRLNAELVKILNAPQSRDKLKDLGLDLIASSPAEFQAFIDAENTRWAEVVRVSGARIEQ
ncbi:tripartite tricarboxylate transporter substrate binding protein [Xanthobacter sp. V4C-4]|uniref:Bug family tripartite tricarboxylate transporter substrate binding protein n=1 Tax=Xanthobacter cornucopiae TaxID=3119924 RepID=UPI0037298540